MNNIMAASPEDLLGQVASTVGHLFFEAENLCKETRAPFETADVIALTGIMVADFNTSMKLKIDENHYLSERH